MALAVFLVIAMTVLAVMIMVLWGAFSGFMRLFRLLHHVFFKPKLKPGVKTQIF